eukprot:s3983_g4.t1
MGIYVYPDATVFELSALNDSRVLQQPALKSWTADTSNGRNTVHEHAGHHARMCHFQDGWRFAAAMLWDGSVFFAQLCSEPFTVETIGGTTIVRLHITGLVVYHAEAPDWYWHYMG